MSLCVLCPCSADEDGPQMTQKRHEVGERPCALCINSILLSGVYWGRQIRRRHVYAQTSCTHSAADMHGIRCSC